MMWCKVKFSSEIAHNLIPITINQIRLFTTIATNSNNNNNNNTTNMIHAATLHLIAPQNYAINFRYKIRHHERLFVYYLIIEFCVLFYIYFFLHHKTRQPRPEYFPFCSNIIASHLFFFCVLYVAMRYRFLLKKNLVVIQVQVIHRYRDWEREKSIITIIIVDNRSLKQKSRAASYFLAKISYFVYTTQLNTHFARRRWYFCAHSRIYANSCNCWTL